MTTGSDLAAWRMIRADLLRRIQTGAWKPGDHIPNEVELAETYRCTRSTVSRALRDLAGAGFLVRRRKGGTRVAPNPTRKAPLDVPIIGDAIEKAGHAHGYTLIAAALEPAPPEATRALGMPEGSVLYHLEALHCADGRPHQYETRWLNLDAAPGILDADLKSTPIDEWLLEFAPLTHAEIGIVAVPAEGEPARHLEARSGEALLLIERTSFRLSKPLGFLQLFHRAGYRITTSI